MHVKVYDLAKQQRAASMNIHSFGGFAIGLNVIRTMQVNCVQTGLLSASGSN